VRSYGLSWSPFLECYDARGRDLRDIQHRGRIGPQICKSIAQHGVAERARGCNQTSPGGGEFASALIIHAIPRFFTQKY
jgi:hypothetical protein